MIKLDGRLGKVFELVLTSGIKIVVDLGCDHGKLGARCAEEGMRVTLTDISQKSLQKARELFKSLGLDGTFVCADGLEGIDYTNALVVIAGMGGCEMIRILSAHKPDYLVLCPHKNAEKLKDFLVEDGYKIIADTITKEGKKFYNIISAAKE